MDRQLMASQYAGAPSENNDYYRQGAKTLMRIVNLQAIAIFVLTGLLMFSVYTHKDRDRYFAMTNEGRVLPMMSLDYPNMGRTALTSWATQAASQIMTFGFNDVDERFALSQKKFTPQGWESFRKAMVMSKLVEDMIKVQQIATSVPYGPAVLTKEGLVRGKYTWSYDVPLLTTFRAGGVKTSRFKTVHMLLELMPTRDNPNAVGIAEWIVD